MNTYKKLYSGNFLFADRLIIALEDQGIVPVVKDEGESARMAGFGSSSLGLKDIWVDEREYDQALQIIQPLLSEDH